MMKKQLLLLFAFLLLCSSIGMAQSQNSIYLLTVSTLENETLVGGVASLDLLITPGTGSIFIESFPLSNVDTQAVTRIATDIACSYSDKDCSTLDFFYTITTNSGFVRGPSAGGATALLALATLQEKKLPRLAMTGGISSAGLITPVGGVIEKTQAAIDAEIPLIIVPSLALNITYDVSEDLLDNLSETFNFNETQNDTFHDLVNDTTQTHDAPLFLEDIQSPTQSVHDVYSLVEAYELVFDEVLPQKIIAEPPAMYTLKMKETSQQLCLRTQELFSEIGFNESNNASLSFYDKSVLAQSQGDYYSSASYCYSANIKLREQIVETLSFSLLNENLQRLSSSIVEFEEQIDSYTLETFSDLEAYIIVKERLNEAQTYVDYINETNISTRLLSLGIERYYSAVAWSGFFGLEGEPLQIDDRSLELACVQEIREVEARLNYLKVSLPAFYLESIQTSLDAAYDHYNENNYPLCIFKASKAKSSAHVFMNDIQVNTQLKDILRIKSQRAQEIIRNQQEAGIFPIIGYSYYEYAHSLEDEQPYTSLLFMEYAIAMSDLNTYFPKKTFLVTHFVSTKELWYLVLGILLGYSFSKLSLSKKQKYRRKRK